MNARAHQSFPWDGIRVDFFEKLPDGSVLRVKDIVIEQVQPGEVSVFDVPHSLNLEMTSAQVLMDDLWNCGIRPTEGAGTAGAMGATQRHLEDMRTLVFRAIDQGDHFIKKQ